MVSDALHHPAGQLLGLGDPSWVRFEAEARPRQRLTHVVERFLLTRYLRLLLLSGLMTSMSGPSSICSRYSAAAGTGLAFGPVAKPSALVPDT